MAATKGCLISIKDAAEKMGVSVQFLSDALRQGLFREFGYAIKPKNSTSYSYVIFRQRFEHYIAGDDLDLTPKTERLDVL